MSEDSASAKFSENIQSSFEAVQAKTEIGLQVVKDYLEFFKTRAKLEVEYSKQLLSFYKELPGVGVFTKVAPVAKDTKTLKEALTGLTDTGLKIAEQHQAFANTIHNDIGRTLDTWVKSKEVDRRKIIEEGKKHLSTLAAARSAAAKAKENYERANKDLEQAKDAAIKARKDEDANPGKKQFEQAAKRADAKVSELTEKVTKAEAAYKEAVSKGNEEIDASKNTKLPGVLDQFQAWDTDRFNTLVTAVKAFKTAQAATPPVFEKASSDLDALLDAASLEGDLKEFIETTKAAEKDAFGALEFVKFKGKYTEDEATASAEDKKEESDEKKEEGEDKAKEEDA